MAGGATATAVKPKKGCCKSDPRCKRCPVVMQRLAQQGLAQRDGKRYLLAAELRKKHMKAARAR
ncbi:MAG TPA: hypothetical protein VF549_18420 [Solirubrobacteraceae bacterium]|jgi:hypothetical protein